MNNSNTNPLTAAKSPAPSASSTPPSQHDPSNPKTWSKEALLEWLRATLTRFRTEHDPVGAIVFLKEPCAIWQGGEMSEAERNAIKGDKSLGWADIHEPVEALVAAIRERVKGKK
jgi:hypothetical protein